MKHDIAVPRKNSTNILLPKKAAQNLEQFPN